ncbi:hypothetical protein P7K49_002974 [Saguinus oedipus]|uniref:Uncharacterized protein n=1 Tax=Saguinus oedipus TaxID=9490 RepID=A0ABQ9WIU4_SAGOE|nr:hypothetical protein P7K49_002974 [Saguinus oedipus]
MVTRSGHGEVTIHYNKLQADPKQGMSLDIGKPARAVTGVQQHPRTGPHLKEKCHSQPWPPPYNRSIHGCGL